VEFLFQIIGYKKRRIKSGFSLFLVVMLFMIGLIFFGSIAFYIQDILGAKG